MDNNVEVYVGFLRRKLAAIGSDVRIKAQRSLGYHLEAGDMIKRLRLKFVAINMTLVTLLLGVILGSSTTRRRRTLESDSINMLRSVAHQPAAPRAGRGRRGP